MNTEISSSLRFEVERVFYSSNFRQETGKIYYLITELQHFLEKSSVFPDYLSPYLEEIVCWMPIAYPLITTTCSPFEAQSLLSLAICRFSTKKIKLLRRYENPSSDIKIIVSVLLLLLSELDKNLQDCFKKLETKP